MRSLGKSDRSFITSKSGFETLLCCLTLALADLTMGEAESTPPLRPKRVNNRSGIPPLRHWTWSGVNLNLPFFRRSFRIKWRRAAWKREASRLGSDIYGA